MDLCNLKEYAKKRAHAIIDKFAESGLHLLAVFRQEVPERTKESTSGPWQFVGLLPLFDSPKHDSDETIYRALNLGVNVKMITGDQLAIAKEIGRRLGMGTNMFKSASLLGQDKDTNMAGLPVEELIEKADGFAEVFPGHKYEIVKELQERKHICGMTGEGVTDAPGSKKANIGIAVAGTTDAARSASDIVLKEPRLSAIISDVLTSRAIFQRMKNYIIYAVSNNICIVFSFTFITLIWKFDSPPFMVLIMAILTDGTIMTISMDRVKPSLMSNSWKLRNICYWNRFWRSHRDDLDPRTDTILVALHVQFSNVDLEDKVHSNGGGNVTNGHSIIGVKEESIKHIGLSGMHGLM